MDSCESTGYQPVLLLSEFETYLLLLGINRLSAFCSPSVIDFVEEEMSNPTDLQLTEMAPPPSQALVPSTEDVTTLPHDIDKSTASTSSPKQRKQSKESMPVSEAPPRAGERSSASSEASSIATEDIAIPSLFAHDVGMTFAAHGRKYVASDSQEFAVLHEAFVDHDSPPFDDFKKRIPTVKKITKQKFALMCVFCLLLPASSCDS